MGGLITIEDVFTLQPGGKRAPDGGHVVLCRPEQVPRKGQTLEQDEQRWVIVEVEELRDGMMSVHRPGANVGLLLPIDLPQPERGEAWIRETHHYVYLQRPNGDVIYDRTMGREKDAAYRVKELEKREGVVKAWSQTETYPGAFY